METQPSANAGAPFSNGRACTSCAQAKAKCVIVSASDTKCGRCTRLAKNCQAPISARKRKSPNKVSSTDSVRLERRLEDLYSLIGTVVSSKDATTNSSSATAKFHLQAQANIRPYSRNVAAPEENQTAQVVDPSILSLQTLTPVPSHGTAPTRPQSPSSLIPLTLEPAEWEAEELLRFFRDDMLGYMPFVTILSSKSASEVHQEYPFMWLCIMAITTKSSAKQTALSRAVRRHLGELMLVEGQRSLDLLYGTIIRVAWGQYYLHNKPILSNLVQLAVAQLVEFGLNKAVSRDMPHLLLEYAAQGSAERYCQSQERTIEERRVVLGCFLVTSVVSNYFSKVEPLLWTSCLDDYLESLAQNKETPGDSLLVHFTRLQLIENKIFRISGLQRVCQTTSAPRSSWSFYLKAMQAELKACRKIIPSELQDDKLLLLHLYSTEGKVHEIAFSDPGTDHRGLELLRIESLYSVLEATKKWFEIYFTFPPAHYVRFSIWVSTQLARCIVLLYRLSTFDHPGWDQSLVRETCNLSAVINDVINNMTQVKSAAGLEYDDELSHMQQFEVNVRKLTCINAWWQSRDNSQRHHPPATAPVAETARSASMDASSDAWLNDLLMMEKFQFESYGFQTGGPINNAPDFGL